MTIEGAKEIMTMVLSYSSRLGKTLGDVQEHLGYGEPTRTYSKAVGEILAWFLFEVLSPLGRQFSEIREWPYEEKDWAADFAHASSTAEALAAVRVVANDGDLLVRELRSKELVSAQGLQEFTDLTLECRRFAE